MFGVGLIVGPALGGLVATWSVRAPFWCASALAVANASVLAVALPETPHRDNRRPFVGRDVNMIGAFHRSPGATPRRY